MALQFRGGAKALRTYSDAGGIGNDKKRKTQGGRIYALTDFEGHKVASWIHWESKVVKRVCRSSAAGECLSAVDAYDASMWLLEMWKELTGQNLQEHTSILTDNEGLIKKVVNTKLPIEKRLRIDIASLRQGLRLGEYKMIWVPSGAMLADSLTKGDIFISPGERKKLKDPLLKALNSNCTFIKGIQTRTASREDVSKY